VQLHVQVREEAGELCQTLEENEGKERAASEMADLLYHAMVLLNVQVRLRGLGEWR
jgi:phosphoribosyl-ATP pyrophosphohydrolase/phosphoribosyl-AMP cyclohydrolase